MSRAYHLNGDKPVKIKYTKHGRTKQSQLDETDINKLLERSARENTLSHLEKFQSVYADFSDYDFEKHITQIAEGQSIFEQLPAETKREFGQSAQRFFEYVTDPANSQDLAEKLPELAKRGTQLPAVDKIQSRAPEEPVEAPKEPTPTIAMEEKAAEPAA